MLKQKPACSRHQSYVRGISAVHKETNQPTLLWLSHRPLLPKTPTTTLSKNSCHLRYWNRLTLCPPEVPRSLTKKLRERRKSIKVWINSGTSIKKTLVPSLAPLPIPGLGNTCSRSRTSIITRNSTIWGTTLSLKKTYQKTSIGLGKLCSDDWY